MIRDKSGKDPAKLPKGVIAVAPPSFRRERALIKRGVWPVAGCDEAGRGPLAGPVVAAAVVLDPKRIPKGIDDSKRLTPERREELFEEICLTASFAVAFASPARIDRDNILRASLWALARAVIYLLPPIVPFWIGMAIDPHGFPGLGTTWTRFGSLAYYALIALLFSTARARNGFAALQDLLTGTGSVGSLVMTTGEDDQSVD